MFFHPAFDSAFTAHTYSPGTVVHTWQAPPLTGCDNTQKSNHAALRLPAAVIAEIKRLFAYGMARKAIAQQTGVSYSSVYLYTRETARP